MLKNILSSSRSKKELKRFEKDIMKISNESAKKQGLELLLRLKKQSNIIDMLHSPMSAPDIDNEKIKENAQTLLDIRKEIYKLIKDASS